MAQFHAVHPPNFLIVLITLSSFVETVESEMKKLEDASSQMENCSNSTAMPSLQPLKVIQSVKCIINLMGNLCTLDLTVAVEELQRVCKVFLSLREKVSVIMLLNPTRDKLSPEHDLLGNDLEHLQPNPHIYTKPHRNVFANVQSGLRGEKVFIAPGA